MTSQQIAKLCGVSKTTVSRVINNDPNVKEETRQLVLSVMEANKYVPVASARRLAGIDSNIIGLFIIDINHEQSTARVTKSSYFSQLGNLIIDKANNSGFQVLVSIITSEHHLTEARNLFLSRMLSSGIFIGALDKTNQLDEIIGLGHPIIVIDKNEETISSNCLAVNLDNFKGGYEATNYLIQLGHKKIGHIAGDLKKLSGKERLAGYKKALSDASIPFKRSWVVEGGFKEELGQSIAKKFVQEQGVTAIFSGNDNMAIGGIKGIKELGLRVPEDIAIIGFDNIEVGKYISPSLSTVDSALETIAQESVAALIHYQKEGHFVTNTLSINAELIIRESTG